MIHPTLFRKELRENRIKFIFIFCAAAALAALIPFIYEPTKDLLQRMNLSPYPGFDSIELLVGSYDNFIWSQWVAKNLTQLSTLAALILGMSVLSSEIAYGTVLFLTGKPLSSREIYTTKAAAGVFLLALVVFLPTLLLIFISGVKGYALDIGTIVLAVSITFTGACVIYLVTIIFSLLVPQPVKALVAAAVFWLAASIPGYFVGTAQYSIFYQMKGISYWLYTGDPVVPLGFFLVLNGLIYELGVWLWTTREH